MKGKIHMTGKWQKTLYGTAAWLAPVLAILLITSCSTEKNTAMTRRVQAIKAHYNTYYNGSVAYLEGTEAQLKGNKDNYMEVLPLYITGNKNTVKLGTGNFDRAVEKCQKAIKQHSITKKPVMNGNKPKSKKDKIWLSQKEYNPFLWKAWFLMGNSQFRKGEYMEAASTFEYIQRLYSTKPDIVARARLLQARCYSEMEWYFEAENIIREAQRDSFPTKLAPLKAQVLANCDIRQKNWADAIPNLLIAAKKQKGSLEKARLCYLLGQLYHKMGNDGMAYKYFGKVYAKNPPYELAFNARIQQTEVMSGRDSKKMIAKLKRMAKSSKNVEYLDQVYYAIGNIYLAQNDTTKAIEAYKEGVDKSTRNGIEKGIVWLHLGRLYWDREKFASAKECYSGALGLYDKDHEDYKDIDDRARILEELYPYASNVELQDSLQHLARMDSVERMKVIEKLIEDVKKKEKEEKRKAATQQNLATQQQNLAKMQQNQRAGTQSGQNSVGLWYFYNPTAVSAGKTEFREKWGDRKMADDWRRKNITVLRDEDEESRQDSIQNDTILGDSILSDSILGDKSLKKRAGERGLGKGDATEADSLSAKDRKRLEKEAEYASDPHRPEYYLKDIPFTEEQMKASDAALVEGLFGAAVIYKDRMENFPLAERTFLRILSDFPDYEHTDETYYNLFQLYSRTNDSDNAAYYKEKLIAEFPDNEHAKKVADPNFEFKGRFGKVIEDSLYQVAYDAYVAEDYGKVITTNDYTATEYPDGSNRARFMFLSTMSRLGLGQREQFMTSMKEIVDKYPKSTVSELAGMYVKGLREGRLLASGKMDNGSIWERRMGVITGEDSIAADTAFTTERNCNFVFVTAY